MRYIMIVILFFLMISSSGCKETPSVPDTQDSTDKDRSKVLEIKEKIWKKDIINKGINYTSFKSVVTDKSGNVYAVGDALTPKKVAVIVKFDSNGKKIWQKVLKCNKYSIELYKIIIDDSSDLYVVGNAGSSGGDISDGNNGHYDALIMKFNSNGKKLWDKTFGGSEHDLFIDVSIGKEGNLYAVGSSNSNDKDITMGNRGREDALIVKFNQNGKKIWDKSFGGGEDEKFNGIAMDAEGYIYVVGDTKQRSNDFPRTKHTGRRWEGVVAKFDTSGEMLWHKMMGSESDDHFNDIVIEKEKLYIVANIVHDNMLFKLDENGKEIWNRKIGSTFGSKHKIVSSNNTVYLIGNTDRVVKLNSDGERLWQSTIVSDYSVSFHDITRSSEGILYAVGVQRRGQGISYGVFLESHGALISKFSNDGKNLWNQVIDVDR